MVKNNVRQLPVQFLDMVIARIRKTMRNNLVAIVLFGSYAKGTAREASDLDLLIIARKLPSGRERDEMLIDLFEDLVIDTGIAVMPILMTRDELQHDMELRGPLMFGLVTGYRVVWGNLPLLPKWEEFVRRHYRLSKRYDAWIIKDRTNPQPKLNLA